MTVRKARSELYRAARDLGNLDAAKKGPVEYGKRVVRRKAYRESGSLTRKLLKALGLSR